MVAKKGISWGILNHHNKAYLPKQRVWHNSLWLGVVLAFLVCFLHFSLLLDFHVRPLKISLQLFDIFSFIFGPCFQLIFYYFSNL
jgi:ABC-type phosphate/phosphonate transport system permease subunit